MEKIPGVTFSHLMTGLALTPGRLKLLLNGLVQIHHSDGLSEASFSMDEELQGLLQTGESPNIYTNHVDKLKSRFESHKEEYRILNPQVESFAID